MLGAFSFFRRVWIKTQRGKRAAWASALACAAALITLAIAAAPAASFRSDHLGPIAEYNWFPGYYVLNYNDSPATKRTILADPLVKPFTGVQFRYHWAASELTVGDYSAGFAALDADLKQVAAAKKKILVMLMYKKFDGTSSVPADLRQSVGPWCSGPYCGELQSEDGTSIALLWNPVVQVRLRSWITAMARHLSESRYIDSVAGIVFNETALGTTDTTVLGSAGYDPDVYIDALTGNMSAALTAAPKLITILYYEGGFVSMNGKSVNAVEKIGDWLLRNPRSAVGTPDLQPKKAKSSRHPCGNSKYQKHIACAPAVQSPDYGRKVTDSFEDSFRYATAPAPDGLRASFLTFSYAVGSGDNAFTFADVSRSIADHPIPNTVNPWPVTPASFRVKKLSLTSPIRPGKVASLTIRVSPRTRCKAQVPSAYKGAQAMPLAAKAGGTITWRWRVAAPGRWPVVVRCEKSVLRLTIRVLPP